MKKLRVALATFVVVLVVLAAWSFWFEPRRLVVRDVELLLPGLPSEADGLRIAVMGDLHVGSPHHDLPKLRAIVGEVNRGDADVVLIAGDLVIQGVLGGRFVEPEAIAHELRALRARMGVFAVLGNHDFWFDAPRVARALEAVGIRVLHDEAVSMVLGDRTLWLGGVSDLWEGEHDIAKTLAGVPRGEPVILFTHNPDIFPDVPERVALTVAGHTHGGQVNLPIVGRPIVPSRYGQRYAAGHVVEQGRHVFVSTGTGTSILPIRFRVPPEIALLTLRSQAAPTVSSASDDLRDEAAQIVEFLRGGALAGELLADSVTLYIAEEGGGERRTVSKQELESRASWRVGRYSFAPPGQLTELTLHPGRHVHCHEASLDSRFPGLGNVPHVGVRLTLPGGGSCLQTWNVTLLFSDDRDGPLLVGVAYDQWEW